MSAPQSTCFVIMPFSKTTDVHTEDYWTGHFEFLKTVVTEAGPNLIVRRSEALRGNILNEIINDLIFSKIVVADLTDANPNVYWELGVRQSFTHRTITIAEEGTRRPFDLGAKGTLYYYPNYYHHKNDAFRNQMKAAVIDCREHPDRPDSHVLEAISGRGTVFEIIHRQETLRRLQGLWIELVANEKVLDKVITTLEATAKDKSKRGFPTVRFMVPATELLITHRYLDANSSLYGSAGTYYYHLHVWNEQLGLWEHSPDVTEKWLLNDFKKSDMKEVFRKFKEEVETARSVLEKRI